MGTESLFDEALTDMAQGRWDDAAMRFRAARARYSARGLVEDAACCALSLVGLFRLCGDRASEHLELRTLERAALSYPGSAYERALAMATSHPLPTLGEVLTAAALLSRD